MEAEHLRNLDEALKLIQESVDLRDVMVGLLAIGNTINPKAVNSIKLDAIVKSLQAKTLDPKLTVADFIVAKILKSRTTSS